MILINTLSIIDSGGMTVFIKMLNEIKNDEKKYVIISNSIIKDQLSYFLDCNNLNFIFVRSRNILYRLFYENVIFRKIIKKYNINLIYNFSGSAQFFLKIPQLVKIHNLLFYSKKISYIYFKNKLYIKWIKQIFLKRIVFHCMLKNAKYIEVQAGHVEDEISNFIDIKNKVFFIKSDVDISKAIFKGSKEYNWSKRIKFLYIIGSHFEYLHKNFRDFVDAMLILKSKQINFEINITLSKEQLHNSKLWDVKLDGITNFLGYLSKEKLSNEFVDNTIVISTSVIETLGLHIIEATQNGILTIAPNEKYAYDVYGGSVIKYKLFSPQSLVNIISSIFQIQNINIKNTISQNQNYLIQNESKKYNSIVDIFDKINDKEI